MGIWHSSCRWWFQDVWKNLEPKRPFCFGGLTCKDRGQLMSVRFFRIVLYFHPLRAYSPPSQDVLARNVPTFCAEFIPGSSKWCRNSAFSEKIHIPKRHHLDDPGINHVQKKNLPKRRRFLHMFEDSGIVGSLEVGFKVDFSYCQIMGSYW